MPEERSEADVGVWAPRGHRRRAQGAGGLHGQDGGRRRLARARASPARSPIDGRRPSVPALLPHRPDGARVRATASRTLPLVPCERLRRTRRRVRCRGGAIASRATAQPIVGLASGRWRTGCAHPPASSRGFNARAHCFSTRTTSGSVTRPRQRPKRAVSTPRASARSAIAARTAPGSGSRPARSA
jgi:hypothetical protein